MDVVNLHVDYPKSSARIVNLKLTESLKKVSGMGG